MTNVHALSQILETLLIKKLRPLLPMCKMQHVHAEKTQQQQQIANDMADGQ